jgi:hypothetical protein
LGGQAAGLRFLSGVQGGQHQHRGRCTVLAISGPRFDFIDRLRQATDQDPTLVAIKTKIASNQRATPWSLVDGLVVFQGRLYIPPGAPLLWEILAAVHDDSHESV